MSSSTASASRGDPSHPPLRVFAPLTVLQIAGEHLCSYCLRPKHAFPAGLKNCSGCKRVAYCSTTCQRSDWKIYHKHFCPQFQKVNKFDKEIIGDRPLQLLEFIQTQEMRVRILSEGNKHGQDDSCNRQFIQHQNVCNICYRTPFQKANATSFPVCQKCNMARWCSEQCKTEFDKAHSPEDCKTLRFFGAVERVQIDYAIARQDRRQLMLCTQDPRKPISYIPLSKIRGWDDYHRRIFPDFKFAYEFTAREFKSSHLDAAEAVKLMAMESTAAPLTIIAGIEAADLSHRNNLTIHFVGAAFREFSGLGIMEELLHYLPPLKKLHICYIGPEVDERLNEHGKNFACEKCRRAGRSRTCSFYNSQYHTLMKASAASGPMQADLIVGLNTGMAGIVPESWKPTLEYILQKKIPSIFTAYTKPEADMEVKLLRGMGAKFLISVEENKWRGVIPTLNIMQKLVDAKRSIGLSYNSNYWYVFQG